MKDDKMLRAVFSNIPISFLTELKKYRTKNSFVRVQYRGRSGRRDSGGSVNLKNAKRFTLYIHGRENDCNYISRDKHFEILSATTKDQLETIRSLETKYNNLKHVSDCADTVLDERFKAIVKLEKDNHALQVALTKEENTRHELISEKNDEITELLKTIRTLSKYLDY